MEELSHAGHSLISMNLLGPQYPWHSTETQTTVSEGQCRDVMHVLVEALVCFPAYRITQFPMPSVK